jgi:C-terminal processing protease CtpA/Prc
VNGKPVAAIIPQLMGAIPADGYNVSEKILLLQYKFAEWYRAICEVTDHFTITVGTAQEEKEHKLKGVHDTVFPVPASLQGERLSFRLRDSLAVLTVRSFAGSDIKAAGQHYKSFLKRAFKQLDRYKVPHLIIDLRYNTGGTDANAVLLCSYLMKEPYRYWDRIEVTRPFAESIKGLARIVYRKPIPTDSLYQWRKSLFTREFNFYKSQHPAKHNYKGKVYVLINGLCLSSCSDLSAVLSHYKRAIFVGQETGGGYQGNTSGLMPKVKLPTGLIVTVPLLKYTNAVNPDVNFGRGTMPDHPVMLTPEAFTGGLDAEMEYTINLINKHP